MRTRGALLRGVGRPWSVEDVEIGEPLTGEVAVKLEAAGLCRSDHHLLTGCLPSAGFPVLGGHEGAGTITAVGPGVERVSVGDHVVLTPGGSGNAYPPPLGTFAPFAVVNERSVVTVDSTVPSTVACLLGCAVLTGHGAATRSAGVRPGDDVAVIGLGGVGMSAVQGAARAGARHVFAIDPVEWKRDRALTFGATHVYPDTQSAMVGMADVTQGLMATKVVVAVGHVDGKDVDTWLILTAKGGACVLAALGDATATDVTANLAINILLQKRLQGSLLGGGDPHHDIPLLASMYLAGKLDLDGMVTREYRLDEINDGFRDMLEGKLIRGVIRYGEQDWVTR
ncbi:alcohol dehydrogenase catalytic domain-containing protein [Mycolicibacterium arenosum]|uniref:Alcohol dehydrogenase catalytic domain-containing protein n=1 Tax=Mycolicibacterium arenosum TaxID=2952157 RepID=A0ABT1M3C1_9MYCO|nr:zinc-binding dehydrogenase [Mycolicibacterium sp. CAU 1645]MCP9273653.1 alcohol dehydrogenase catalytic domain-containing protein [Mycolicibacterium sp. CAU 1645]